jgi:hypothetical protein
VGGSLQVWSAQRGLLCGQPAFTAKELEMAANFAKQAGIVPFLWIVTVMFLPGTRASSSGRQA